MFVDDYERSLEEKKEKKQKSEENGDKEEV